MTVPSSPLQLVLPPSSASGVPLPAYPTVLTSVHLFFLVPKALYVSSSLVNSCSSFKTQILQVAFPQPPTLYSSDSALTT